MKLPDHKLSIKGTLVVEGNISDSGELYVKTKPDEWALIVGGDLFLRAKSDIWGKVWVGGNIKFPDTAGTEPIPIAKYHVKGKAYVMGECFVNGRFHINHLDVTQRVGEIILIADEGKEELKWIDTYLIGDYQEGEPGVAIIEFKDLSGNLMAVVIGDSINYGTDLLYGISYEDILDVAHEAETQLGIKFERIAFIPTIFFIGILSDGSGVILFPRKSITHWEIVNSADLEDYFSTIKEVRLDPSGIEARKEEWEFYNKKYQEYFSPHSPGWCDGHINWVSVYKSANKDEFDRFDYGHYFLLSWNFTQGDFNGVFSCGPVSATQIFAYNRDIFSRRCVYRDNEKVAEDLAKAMGTEKRKVNGKIYYDGDTMPWDVDEGIESVASDYGYTTQSNWTGGELTSSGLWHEFYDYIEWTKMPQIFQIGGPTSEFGDHMMTVVGALRYWWDWWCFSMAKHWIYYFNNWDRILGRYRLDAFAHGYGFGAALMVWEGVTVSSFKPTGYLYPDIDYDGYGSLLSIKIKPIIDSCPYEETPPAGYSYNSLDCDDSNPNVNPGMPEICDDIDNDCDGGGPFGLLPFPDEGCDDDNDGYCDINMTVIGTPSVCPYGGGDCYDEGDYAEYVHPGATEYCDSYDEDCDGEVDEDCTSCEFSITGSEKNAIATFILSFFFVLIVNSIWKWKFRKWTN